MTSPRLLLVDDDPDMGLVVRILGRRCGYDLVHHPDAESAWAGLDADRPDLILLDVNLPGTSGPEFLRRLRASPVHARYAVALFGRPELTNDVADGWAAGADYHLSKDLVTRPDAWKQRLDEILTHLRGRDSDSSIYITGVVVPANPQIIFPRDLSKELLDAMMARAGATNPQTTEELAACCLRLIDQAGCLFGRAAVDAILGHFRDDSSISKKPPRHDD